jgi:polysaccharide pyruvyl transferase WcaK-like protein
VQRLIEAGDSGPLIGLNVSGLIANQPQAAAARFGLAGDYRELMHELVAWILQNTDARLLLVPHVHAPRGHYESDLEASLSLLSGLPPTLSRLAQGRVAVVSEALDARELKWLIGQTDWFCGTRMHSTIAALSSGVATAALAYSLKTRGVFATCGMGEAVVDLREAAVADALTHLQQLWRHRQEDAAKLAQHLPAVRHAASRQLDEIVDSALGAQVSGRAVAC